MSVIKKFIPEDLPLPKHVAIIMDGNNRWAKSKHLPSLAGHKAGVGSVRRVITACAELRLESLTLFAFSSENWRRPEAEVKGLMSLFKLVLDRELSRLKKNNIRLRVIGDVSRFSESLRKRILNAEKETSLCTGLQLNIAANYGGRWDITEAAKALALKCQQGELNAEDITAEMLGEQVSLADQAPPDLCIRTAGERRISNFLIWQFAYTEFFYSPCYWPDFDESALADALFDFSGRERRFGRTSEQLEAEQQGA